MNYMVIAVCVLGLIALIASVVLYICSKKFAVEEDGRVARVAALLPQANCGGCGHPGCAGFADALVKASDNGNMDGMVCPVGGPAVMDSIAKVLGLSSEGMERRVAIVRCAGDCELRSRISQYDGLRTCAVLNMCGMGELSCGYGCLGCGDCVKACQFGAITINKDTGIAEVDRDKCTGCGACTNACPRHIIELCVSRPADRLIYVACMNKDRGPLAIKSCNASCIGCGKCKKECPADAITIEDNLAHIDSTKCSLCGNCVTACVRHSIHITGDPLKKDEHQC